MPYKRGQRWLQSARKSILGDGLLERARSTSLALLGLTAAVGLTMVAMVLNQGWPLIAGAPIPGFGDKHQAVGGASIAAEPNAPSGGGAAPLSVAGRQGSGISTSPVRKDAGGAPASADSKPVESESIVVSNSTPASTPAESSPGDASPNPAPAGQQPAVTPTPATPPAPAPAVSPPAQPPAPPVSTPSSQPPVSSAGAPPPESTEDDIDESEDDVDDDCPPEEEWDGGHDRSHGWHRGHGRW